MAHDFRISRHAREEIHRRGIPLDFGGGHVFLLRVIVDESRVPPVVVTVYRTSKVEKY